MVHLSNFFQSLSNFGRANRAKLQSLFPHVRLAKNSSIEGISDQIIVSILPAVIGPRTHLDGNPEEIAHASGHFAFTTPQHGVDITANIANHTIVNAPLNIIDQSVIDLMEHAYDPLYSDIVQATYKREQFLPGLLHWYGQLFNFNKSNLGGFSINSVLNRYSLFQSSFVIHALTRTLIGGKTLAQASTGWLYMTIAAPFSYLWLWHITRVGNNLEAARLAEKSKLLTSLQNKLATATGGELLEAYKKLAGLYTPPIKLENIERHWNDPEMAPILIGLILEIKDALESKNKYLLKSRSELLHFALSDEFDHSRIDTVLKLNLKTRALRLADYSAEKAPFATLPNRAIAPAMTFFKGALLTTAIGLVVMVKSANNEMLTFPEIATLTAELFAFFAVAFLFFSKRSHDYFIPCAKKLLNFTLKN